MRTHTINQRNDKTCCIYSMFYTALESYCTNKHIQLYSVLVFKSDKLHATVAIAQVIISWEYITGAVAVLTFTR